MSMAKLTVRHICTESAGQADLERFAHFFLWIYPHLTLPILQHGLAINLVDGPKSMVVLKEIERHFGKDIAKLDAEDVDEIEKLNQD